MTHERDDKKKPTPKGRRARSNKGPLSLPYDASAPTYEHWSLTRLETKARCSVEPGMRCIPLRSDPICRTCYETDRFIDKKSQGGA